MSLIRDPSANIVFRQAKTGAAGNGFNEVNVPFDAKVVGDSTGLTPPF
jgi:hypothetical protein